MSAPKVHSRASRHISDPVGSLAASPFPPRNHNHQTIKPSSDSIQNPHNHKTSIPLHTQHTKAFASMPRQQGKIPNILSNPSQDTYWRPQPYTRCRSPMEVTHANITYWPQEIRDKFYKLEYLKREHALDTALHALCRKPAHERLPTVIRRRNEAEAAEAAASKIKKDAASKSAKVATSATDDEEPLLGDKDSSPLPLRSICASIKQAALSKLQGARTSQPA